MNVECPHCGKQYPVDHQFIGQKVKCPDCGNVFEVVNRNLFPCPDCFAPISRRAAVCPKCGAPLAPGASNANTAGSIPYDLSTERKIKTYHPSAMNYFWGILFGIVTLPVLIGLFVLFAIIIEMNCTSYELTTHRIIVRKGWIAKMQNEIWIKDMRAVNLIQGIWQRMVGIGNIAIGTAASAGTEIHIVGIANPEEVVSQINNLRKI